MAALDVDDVLDDPDFNSPFAVTRSSTSVVNGVGHQTQSVLPGILGVVTPATGLDVQRFPDMERASGAITIYTRFALIQKEPGYTADIVAWQGRNYTVMTVEPWLFGSGYYKALCQLLDLD